MVELHQNWTKGGGVMQFFQKNQKKNFFKNFKIFQKKIYFRNQHEELIPNIYRYHIFRGLVGSQGDLNTENY